MSMQRGDRAATAAAGRRRSSSRSVRPRTSSLTMYRPSVDFLERVDGRDRGMRERGRGARLARQPRPARRVARVRGRQRLERDHASEPLVLRGVDDPHPAAADFLGDSYGPICRPIERVSCGSSSSSSGAAAHTGASRNVPGALVAREQRSHFAGQFRDRRASSSASRRSRSARVALEQLVEERR